MSDDKVLNFEELKKKLEGSTFSIEKIYAGLDDKLKEMNEKHSFVHSVGGKPLVTNRIYSDAFNRIITEFVSPDSIVVRYSNEPMYVEGRKTPISLGQWWIQHPQRKSFNGVFFDPSKPKEHDGNLNLWEDFRTVPKQGSWRYTKRHIWSILCNRDKKKFKYVMRWFAWCIQNPEKRAEVAIIFKGKQGAGKGFIFTQFVHMFGAHGMSISNRELLTGKHNGHLAKICFLFADEAYYPGDKEVEGVLKQLISEPSIAYRHMYRDAAMGANRLHIGMATNSDWVIPAASDSRRYFINEVDNRYAMGECDLHMRDRYFKRLWNEMKKDGREAMMFDLKNIKLKGWHPRNDIPETDELDKQKHLSLSRLHMTIFSILEDGVFPGEKDKRGRWVVSSDSIYKYIEKIDDYNKRYSSVKKAEIIKILGAEKERKTQGIFWIFPELHEMRLNWSNVYTKQIWKLDEIWQPIKFDVPY